MKFLITVFYFLAVTLTAEAHTRQWTVMVYWAVDNDLYEFSKPYLHQFENLPNSEDVTMVLEYDFPDHRKTKRFQILHSDHFDPQFELSNSILLEEFDESDSADPRVLKNFIQTSKKRFPAENYLLIIGSHGSNWSGLIEDQTSRHYMPLAQFGSAVENENIDLVLFDTCRMAFLESLMTLNKKIPLMLASPFDVNGFDHINPLRALMVDPLLPVSELGSLYVKHYPLKPENAESKEMMASFLNTTNSHYLVDDFEKLAVRLNQKSSHELNALKDSLIISVNEENDWNIDLFELVKRAGEYFPDLLLESQMFKMKYYPDILEVARTSVSLPHSGLSVACAQKINAYGMTEAGKQLSQWRNLCQHLRKI